jgi:ABC-2 type transport system ATP-binding protein
MEKILSIQNLSKKYGNITALDDLSLDIHRGQVFGFLGPNGSGKTTTLGIVLGILGANSGGYEWFEGKYGEYHRRRIGSLLETPNFYAYLNADQNLDIVAHIKKSKNDNIEEILDIVNLKHRRKSKFSTYSLGMKQRLAIASAMIGDPDVYIFDEPTNGLDPEGIAEIRSIILRIASTGKTIFMASHILDEVEKVCSDVAIIKNGKLLATGTVGHILNDIPTIQVRATDMAALENALKNMDGLTDVRMLGDLIECGISPNMKPEEVNRRLQQQNIILGHLSVKKKRLEEEFLAITNNN